MDGRGNHGASPSGQPVASAVLLQCQLQREGSLHSAARSRFMSGQEDLPGLGFPSGHALPQPLGVWSQVVDQLSADLIRGLDGVGVLQNRQTQFRTLHTHIFINILLIINMNAGSISSLLMSLQHECCLKNTRLLTGFPSVSSLLLIIYCKSGSCSA